MLCYRTLLFIIYINDLPLVVRRCSVELHGDDTLIYFARKSVSEVQANLTSDLINVLSWLQGNALIFNLEKKLRLCLLILIRGPKRVNMQWIDISNTHLDRAYNFKHLGSSKITLYPGRTHPRRPRGSQSGREKRRDESFQVRAKEPLGTDSHQTISINSNGCRLLIGHKINLCVIVPNLRTASPEFFSCVRTRRLLSRHICLVRSPRLCVHIRKGNFHFLLP